MRLKLPRNFVPARERVEIPGDLHAYLTDSARDYQATHGAPITLRSPTEIPRAFLRGDPESWAWLRRPPPPL